MQQLHPAPRSPLAGDAPAGRRAVVTGASRGIGPAVCVALARAGADVARIALGPDDGDAAAEVADVIAFPDLGRARYATGQELVVDGGLTINGTVGHARS